jgi:hypothetical protein
VVLLLEYAVNENISFCGFLVQDLIFQMNAIGALLCAQVIAIISNSYFSLSGLLIIGFFAKLKQLSDDALDINLMWGYKYS